MDCDFDDDKISIPPDPYEHEPGPEESPPKRKETKSPSKNVLSKRPAFKRPHSLCTASSSKQSDKTANFSPQKTDDILSTTQATSIIELSSDEELPTLQKVLERSYKEDKHGDIYYTSPGKKDREACSSSYHGNFSHSVRDI